MPRDLRIPSLLVYAVILYRAAHQAVTLDEADAFNSFAASEFTLCFYPSSGNHVLNSLLARYATQAFGVSPFTFRMPAMLGAAVYLLAAASICARIAPERLRLAFALLTLNPFFLDYLIASRGYALALGFLAAAVAVAMRNLDGNRQGSRDSVLISICLALSLAANFSFAFAVVSTLAALLLTQLFTKAPFRTWIAQATLTVLPGALLGYALVGQTIRDFPRGQLYYGAQTWAEMWTWMLDAVFPRENLCFTAFDLGPVLTVARDVAPYLVVIAIAIALRTFVAAKSWSMRFVWLTLALALTMHGAAHSLRGLLLPQDRTSIFIAFFLSLIAIHGATSAPPLWARRASTAVLSASLAIFVLSFRTNYFRIWDFDLDVDLGFHALVQYAADHPVESVGCTWRYNGAFNFYRSATAAKVPACEPIDQDNPPLRAAYFVHVPEQAEFIERTGLQVIYRGPVSGLVVGIRPR